MVIADRYQAKGLGRKLVDMVIDIAVEKRLSLIYGVVLKDNAPMLSLCREMGFVLTPKDDYYEAELTLRVEEPPQPEPQAEPKVEQDESTESLAQ